TAPAVGSAPRRRSCSASSDLRAEHTTMQERGQHVDDLLVGVAEIARRREVRQPLDRAEHDRRRQLMVAEVGWVRLVESALEPFHDLLERAEPEAHELAVYDLLLHPAADDGAEATVGRHELRQPPPQLRLAR